MKLNKLRDKAYQCAVAHGWHEENLSDEHFLCLVISELMEAVEADRKGRHADIKKFNQEMDYYIHEMKLYGENYDKAYRDTFEYYLKDSVEDELSDACIRLLDLAGLRNINLSSVSFPISNSAGHIESRRKLSFTELCYDVASLIARYNKDCFPIGFLFVGILQEMCCIAEIIGFDILWHIEQKIKYNELRPYKHGGLVY